MSSDALIKCVAHKLKYHMNVVQREEGFCPSGNCFKYENPVVYPIPSVLLPHRLVKYPRKKRPSSSTLPENRISVLPQRKQRYSSISYYPHALVDKRRKERVVKIASKILVALGCYEDSDLRLSNSRKALPRIRKASSSLMNIHQRMQHFYDDSSEEEEEKISKNSDKELELNEDREKLDLTYNTENFSESRTDNDSCPSEKGNVSYGIDIKEEAVEKPTTSREKHVKLDAVTPYKKKISNGSLPPHINDILPEPYDILVESSTQTKPMDQPILQKPVCSEISSAPVTNYKIVVKTGNELGASTRAHVKIMLYGDEGRTKPIELLESKTNKIKFQKGKEDHFFVETVSVGHLEKIYIGHDRPELPYAWFLDQVTIFDLLQKWTYEFPCAQWFSGQGGDRRIYRNIALGNHYATSEDINNVPVDRIVKLLSETENSTNRSVDGDNNLETHYITAQYDQLCIGDSADEGDSFQESAKSNVSFTSEEYGSEKKVISVQNYVTVETQTGNVQNSSYLSTTDSSYSTSSRSKLSKSESKSKTTKSIRSKLSRSETSTENSSSPTFD
ncbi:uncharacterized protein LOC115211626 [Argonauta hians]